MRAKVIALPVAAGLALGGASLAAGAPDAPTKPAPPVPERPAVTVSGIVGPPPMLFAEPGPFGLHSEIAEDMAKELNLPAERVVDAMRNAIAAQFDRRRDEALRCFDDRKKCAAAAHFPPFLPERAIRVHPRGRVRTP